MPKKILATQRSKFWRLRTGGHSIREASIRCGFSESYGKMLVRTGLGAAAAESVPGRGTSEAQIEAGTSAEIASRPRHPWELSEVARDCLYDFERFRARYLGSVSMPWHVEAAQLVIDHLESEDNEWGVFNAPQGGGKTRLGHDICAWLTVRDRTLRGCLGSGTMRIAESMVGNLRNTFARKTPVSAAEKWKLRGMARDGEATLAQDYGRFRPEMEGAKWTRPEFVVEQLWDLAEGAEPDEAVYRGAGMDKEATWAAFSYEAQVMSLRFDFGWWDDVHTARQMRNPDVMADLFDWWDTEAESRFDPGALCLVTMQRLGSNDLSRHLLDKIDPAFEIDADRPDEAPRQYFHVKFKAHYDDRCLGEHTHTADAVPYPEGCMLDPKRLGRAYMNVKKTAGTFEIVAQQEDVDPSNVLVQRAWVEECWDEDRMVGELPRVPDGATWVRFMTVDPSPTKFWGVIDWLYVLPTDTEQLAGYRHVINLTRARMGANEFLDWSRDQDAYVGLAEEWVAASKAQGVPITAMVMEKNAAQRWAMQYEFFRTWSQTRGVAVLQHETMNNKSDPELGVWTTIPNAWRHSRVRLPGADRASRLAVNPLVQEVCTYPGAATDDCVMSEWFGEYNLGDLIGGVLAQTNRQGFYQDQPTWLGGENVSFAARRIAEMVHG